MWLNTLVFILGAVSDKICFNNPSMGTVARKQFMRGTDPIKSTWEYPKEFYCKRNAKILYFSLVCYLR